MAKRRARKSRSEVRAWEFAVVPAGSRFVVVVRSEWGGDHPVGPRLLRGVPIADRFLSSVYNTEAEAFEALAKWKEYSENYVFSDRAKENRSKARKMGKV